ncbi:arylsulfotransferase ASST [Aliiruegeria haliotis]|uniref:Arylsulfotransferase ASST n=1 Tax=Aliiruegeria haliotis TaxID=1280846 RepID=A0A2T0RRP2_9RHOB|nr:arylsulfotransferase family protein [Aliiruegeria haliotis]PRY23787.1 arylsulfotransferase ASST [Aliiruegeria haliotis]
MRSLFKALPQILFVVSILATTYLIGALSMNNNIFPIPQLKQARQMVKSTLDSVFKRDTQFEIAGEQIMVPHPERIDDRLILLSGVGGDRLNFLRVIDRTGAVVHEIKPDWFEIWPDDSAFPRSKRPKQQPGATLHGFDILPDGDIVVNFEHLSTFRIDLCGEVQWKLANLGHHSVHLAEDDVLWVSAEESTDQNPSGFRNHHAPVASWTIQQVSLDGDILSSVPVIRILEDNDLLGLLFASSLENTSVSASGDTLHLNDIEVFPSTLQSDVFEPGDILFSLRNINSVLVIDPDTHRLKYHHTGHLLRQHDPDFIGGNLISVFDNRNLKPSTGPGSLASRVVVLDAATGAHQVVLDGAGENGFFTDIMGDHQHTRDGNILVTSSREGRIAEYGADGTLLWRYQNNIGDGRVGLISGSMLLPPEMDTAFFAERARSCQQN